MTQSLYTAIPIIMNRFDFKQVEKVMECLNWNWATGRPTLAQLRDEALNQLNCCVDEFYRRNQPPSGMLIASGGFEATVQTFESGQPRLQLTFYVDSTSSAGEY